MAEPAFINIEDFVFNPSFRDWVLHNDAAHQATWEKWMAANPHKIAVMQHAKSIVYALSADHSQLSEQEIDHAIRDILNAKSSIQNNLPDDLRSSINQNQLINAKQPARFKWLAGAAAAAALVVVSFLYFNDNGYKSPGQEASQYSASDSDAAGTIARFNPSDTILIVMLPDSSRVELAARSGVTYSADSFRHQRTVQLTGEAFFDVKKMPAAPFLVYTNSMVTKVLGTSFRVKEFPGDKKAIVWVKTGKVSVYKQKEFSASDAASKQLDGIIIIPNQQVTYDVDSRQLTKNIIDKPVLLSNTADEIFAFHSTPLKEVFLTLERAYGIQLMYDETMISSCSLSVNMGNESFYEKLDLICRTINASYEVIDGSIYITSHGCK
ncbi:MAG: FecR family protein [Chitinophagaceae bacterium]